MSTSSVESPRAPFLIRPLPLDDANALADAARVLDLSFNDPVRYPLERLVRCLEQHDGTFYNRFVIAEQHGDIVGVGGVKAADWASDTHLLYLSAVAPHARGQGIGKALVEARLAWLRQHLQRGRVLVSTTKRKRFEGLGFKELTGRSVDGKALMMLELAPRRPLPLPPMLLVRQGRDGRLV